MRVLAVIAFRPFLCVTDGTYGTQVGSGHEVTLRVILYQIGERQFRSVGMVGMTSHDQRERTYLGWPQQITVAGGLRTAFGDTLVDRTEFVHVVRLVAARTGVQEREHTGYQECGLMVRHGIWSGEDSTCLAVHALAVTEEQALTCRIVFVEDTTLTDKTLVHQR